MNWITRLGMVGLLVGLGACTPGTSGVSGGDCPAGEEEDPVTGKCIATIGGGSGGEDAGSVTDGAGTGGGTGNTGGDSGGTSGGTSGGDSGGMSMVPSCEDWTDDDGDGKICNYDNCPATANPDQKDSDGDGVGDACDNCPNISNSGQRDKDGDGTGNACTEGSYYDASQDSDGDGTPDIDDLCPNKSNPGQKDPDGDKLGTACDNCPNTANYDQTDSNNDGIGDACTQMPVGQICKRKSAQFKKLQPNIYIALDKSGSMGSSNKMGQAKQALDQVVTNLSSQVRFGLLAYSSNCSPPELLPVGSHSTNAIQSSYRSVSPGGGTGTGGALGTIRSRQLYWNASNANRKQRPKSVILVSDGCANSCGGQSKAASEATRLQNAGVKVFSIGFSNGACEGQLNEVARNGGTNQMYQANNASQLSSVIQNISNKVISCTYKVQAPSNKIWVKIAGNTISRSQYTYDGQQGVLTLEDSACQQLQNVSSSHPKPLELVFGCATKCQPEGEEVCDYKDNDCDGEIDENCEGCNAEICNGEDDDCDGQIDEGCPPCALQGDSCTQDSDCCNDNCTDEGVCGPPCRPTETTCTQNGQCCSNVCTGGGGRSGTCITG